MALGALKYKNFGIRACDRDQRLLSRTGGRRCNGARYCISNRTHVCFSQRHAHPKAVLCNYPPEAVHPETGSSDRCGRELLSLPKVSPAAASTAAFPYMLYSLYVLWTLRSRSCGWDRLSVHMFAKHVPLLPCFWWRSVATNPPPLTLAPSVVCSSNSGWKIEGCLPRGRRNGKELVDHRSSEGHFMDRGLLYSLIGLFSLLRCQAPISSADTSIGLRRDQIP